MEKNGPFKTAQLEQYDDCNFCNFVFSACASKMIYPHATWEGQWICWICEKLHHLKF